MVDNKKQLLAHSTQNKRQKYDFYLILPKVHYILPNKNVAHIIYLFSHFKTFENSYLQF